MRSAPLHLLVWGCLTTLPALAAPRFVADDPADAALATKAWGAAEACTGWTPPHHDTVVLKRTAVHDGYDGRAYVDGQGLYRIEVEPGPTGRPLLHELAHAWAWRGPPALTEGRTDLLADCMASRMPGGGPLDPDPGQDLDHLPDLRRWTNPRGRNATVDVDEELGDAYLGASRLMRVVSTVVPPSRLWPEDGLLRWRTLEALLASHGPKGSLVLDVLDGGAPRQAEALSDQDRDGQPWLGELLDGTDPDRWDSDGDGWWDGASDAPSGAVPLPPDGSAVCSGMAASASGANVQVRYRITRALAPPTVRVITGDVWIVEDPAQGVHVEPHLPVLLALDGGLSHASGGAWARVGGQGLVDAWNCRSTPRYTVWVADPTATPDLARFVQDLDEHMHRADGLLGPSTQRTVVALGAPKLGVTDDMVLLPMPLLAWARKEGRTDALAGLAVAVHRTWQASDEDARRWDTVEALARALIDDPPDTLFVTADREQQADRASLARRCGGWRALVDGTCRQPSLD